MIGYTGLALAIGVGILLYGYIKTESAYDTFHPDVDRLYRTALHLSIEGVDYHEAVSQFPFGQALQNEFQEVQEVVRIYRDSGFPLVQHNNNKFVEEHVLYSDPGFFSVFGFPVISGNPTRAFEQLNSVVLSDAAARRYFGNEDPVGKTILFNREHTLEVVAVVDNAINSHIRFELIIPLAFQQSVWKANGRNYDDNWFWTAVWTYIKLNDGVSEKAFAAKLPVVIDKYFPERYKKTTIELQPVKQIHTQSNLDTEITPNNNAQYLSMFAISAIVIVIIASINFLSLSNALLFSRFKEHSIKRIMGSSGIRIFSEQFSLIAILSFGALLTGFGLAYLFKQSFSTLMESQVTWNTDQQMEMLAIGILFCLTISILGSIKPMLIVLRANPMRMIKQRVEYSSSKSIWQRGFLSAQTGAAFVLIFCTFVIFFQMKQLINRELGFSKKHVVILPAYESINRQFEAFETDAKSSSAVSQLTGMNALPGKGGYGFRFVPEGSSYERPFMLPHISVGYDFIRTMNIRLLDGRDFDKNFPTDRQEAFIVNESFLEEIGWEGQGVGKELDMFGAGTDKIAKRGKIIGVVEDYHFESLHFPIKPLVLSLTDNFSYYLVKINEGQVGNALTWLKSTWARYENDWPFEYKFLDAEWDRLYKNESKLTTLALGLSIISIVLTCMGLFALNSVMLVRGQRVTAIRKVLGASARDIIKEKVMEQLAFGLVAMICLAPVAWLVMSGWLGNFSYKINMTPAYFVYAMAIVFTLALVTMSYHLIKLIHTNPIHYIRNE